MKSKTISLVYVDDTVLAGTNKYSIEFEIVSRGVRFNKHRHKFGLRYEGKVGYFLVPRK